MKNIPQKIYLQIGEDVSVKENDSDFNDLAGVSWCADKINNTDIEYILKSEETFTKEQMIQCYIDAVNNSGDTLLNAKEMISAEEYLESIFQK
jgi:hypothetical protein